MSRSDLVGQRKTFSRRSSTAITTTARTVDTMSRALPWFHSFYRRDYDSRCLKSI
jgi:hypothetical protein